MIHPVHSYLAIEIPNAALKPLCVLQRRVRDIARRAGFDAHSIPRKLVHLPLDHIGETPPAALEAVDLATRRILKDHKPFELAIDELGLFPGPDAPCVVAAGITEGGRRLASLRAALHDAYLAYGFELSPWIYVPHVPLIRLRVDPGACAIDPFIEAFHESVDFGRPLAMSVQHVTLFHRDPFSPYRYRFRARWRCPLDSPTGRSKPSAAAAESARREEIRAEFERLTARRERLRIAPIPDPPPQLAAPADEAP